MADGKRRRRAVAAGVPATLLLAFANPTAAMALRQPDYPSWDEVEDARRDEATAQAKVDEIEGILIRLEADAAEYNRTALELGEEFLLAQGALDEATAKLDRLTAQADTAQTKADESEQRVAVLVAQLARGGSGDVTLGLLLGSADDTDALLRRLGMADRLSTASAAMLTQAMYDKKTAEALAKDARAAERQRQRLADEAQEARDIAQAAADEAQAKADAQRADVDRMYAQLAALKGTTLETEREYQEGLAANPPSQPSNPSNPTNPPPTPTNPPPTTPTNPPVTPPPVSSAVETAIAFATAQVGDRYQLGGMGPDAWDCSGLAKASYAAAGVYIGTHSSTDQYNRMSALGRLVPIGQVQRGDLVFYSDGGSAANPRKYHVAIYLGNGKMIEAPNPSAPVRIVNLRQGDLVPFAGRPTG
jgi:cell wall-associated NlpC family hydrolase